jgi:tetratricopeptide (TPR) repeat protein
MTLQSEGRAMRAIGLGAALIALWALGGGPAGAVTGLDAEPPPAAANDPYTAGVAAFEQEDWAAVLVHMSAAVDARPWLDNAYNLMGFAHRKLGDYDAALAAYERALDLNPHNRGALEYLGEAYLELDRPDDAEATLEHLATACRMVTPAAVEPLAQCEEWQELNEAYEAYRARGAGAGSN